MAEDDNDNRLDAINYVKETLKSEVNLGFIGVMAFLMLVVNFWAFLPLLIAGQLGGALLAQSPLLQRLIRLRKVRQQKQQNEESEKRIVEALPSNYQSDFESVRGLCEEIERRSSELGTDGSNRLLGDIVEKLSAFRYEYARMLRAHHLLSTRNYRQLQGMLGNQIAQAEAAVEKEEARQVRYALTQNLSILKQRLARIKKLDELVRLLEARLQVIKNSLGLIQDEVYTFTDVAGIQGLVDNLLINLSISEEFRADYEDVLSTEASETALFALEAVPAGRSIGASSTQADAQTTARPTRLPRKQAQRIK
ncbi:MAG TPA: hypothetical protein VF666_09595 [Pyrinomonadaceae bacterium]|jgi:hypothetical protein